MGEETAVKNGWISDFQGLVTLTLDRVILHAIMHHPSTSTYIPNFTEIEETFCGSMYGRTFETHFIRSMQRSRPKKWTVLSTCTSRCSASRPIPITKVKNPNPRLRVLGSVNAEVLSSTICLLTLVMIAQARTNRQTDMSECPTQHQQLYSQRAWKGFPYSLLSAGPGPDTGVQAVSPQVTKIHPPSGRLPLFSARPAVTFPDAGTGTKLYLLGARGT